MVGLRKASHRQGSLDDALRRGSEIGYDEGFAAGRRNTRPVLVPLRLGSAAPVSPVGDLGQAGVGNSAPTTREAPTTRAPWGMEPKSPLPWGGEPVPAAAGGVNDRVVDWMGERWAPVLAGLVGLALVAIGVATAMAGTQAPAVAALQKPPGRQVVAPVTPFSAGPAPVSKPGTATAPVVADDKVSAVVPGAAGAPSQARAASGLAATAAAASVWSASSPAGPVIRTGVAVAVPASTYRPAAPAPAPAPAPVTAAPAPFVAAPALPLTAAQKTAADAAAAAASTAATAACAAAETARVAAAAADETARVAAAAAEATRLQALADAYAVAHPAG